MTHTDEERDALQWLDRAENRIPTGDSFAYSLKEDKRHRATIRRMATRPAMPEEPPKELLEAMRKEWWRGNGGSYDVVREIYRAAHTFLTRPKTKTETFKRWLVVAPGAEMGPYLCEAEARGIACGRKGSVIIELTGSGEVPA